MALLLPACGLQKPSACRGDLGSCSRLEARGTTGSVGNTNQRTRSASHPQRSSRWETARGPRGGLGKMWVGLQPPSGEGRRGPRGGAPAGALGSGFCVAFIPEPRMPASVGDRSLEVLIQPCPSPKNLKSQPSPWGGRVAICAIPLFLLLGSVLSTAQGAKPIPSLLGP